MNNNCKNPRRMNLASLLFVSEKHDFVSRKNICSPRPSPAICVRCLYTRTTLHPTYSSRASLEGSTCRARNRERNKFGGHLLAFTQFSQLGESNLFCILICPYEKKNDIQQIQCTECTSSLCDPMISYNWGTSSNSYSRCSFALLVMSSLWQYGMLKIFWLSICIKSLYILRRSKEVLPVIPLDK